MRLWSKLSGRSADFAIEEQAARREIIARSFSASSRHALAASTILRVPRATELSRAALRRALIELLAHFPIYRTYATARERPAADEPFLAQAVAAREVHLPAGRSHGDRPALHGWLARAADAGYAGGPAGAGRHAISAVERAGRREGGRGYRLLPLWPPALAQRCRLRCRAFERQRGGLPRQDAAPSGRISRTRCWQPRPTTTSAARMCARGSRSERVRRRMGERQSPAGSSNAGRCGARSTALLSPATPISRCCCR